MQKNEFIHKQYKLLTSITGIGDSTSTALLAELPVYDGITPKHNASGKSIYKRSSISKIGNTILRKILYFLAITAARFNKTLSNFFLRPRSNGKSKIVSIIAVMRKLVHIMFGVLKNEENYQENYISNITT